MAKQRADLGGDEPVHPLLVVNLSGLLTVWILDGARCARGPTLRFLRQAVLVASRMQRTLAKSPTEHHTPLESRRLSICYCNSDATTLIVMARMTAPKR